MTGSLLLWFALSARPRFCPNDTGTQAGCAETCSTNDVYIQGASTMKCTAQSNITAGGLSCTDCVALGTETTGGYAASVSEGGPATTATALAANGANCSAGNYPLGVDASGAVETCTADDDTPDNDGEVPDTLTIGSGSNITLAQGANPTPTAEGRIEWETDDDHIIVGDAAAAAEFVPAEDVSGDATMDDAGAVTIAANAVALTTDTTGNYVASVATSSPLSGGAAGSEGGTLTLSIADAAADGATKGAAAFAAADFTAASGVITLAADPGTLGAITPTSVDAGTGAINTGADTTLWVDALALQGANPFVGSISSGHWTMTGSVAGFAAYDFGLYLPVPAVLMGTAVKIRSVLVYFACSGTAAFDELTLYVQDVTAGTFTDIERQTTNQTSGPYTFGGLPYTMGSNDALMVSGLTNSGAAGAVTFYGVKIVYDSD